MLAVTVPLLRDVLGTDALTLEQMLHVRAVSALGFAGAPFQALVTGRRDPHPA